MQGKRILVVGYGKLGRRVAQQLSNTHEVTAIKRSPEEHTGSVTMCYADITQVDSLQKIAQSHLDNMDYVIYCLSPSERTEKGYQDAYLSGLKNISQCLPKLSVVKQIIFVSSTSVYHQKDGEPVDESSPCLPNTFSGKILLEAEAYLHNLSVATTSVRFSGIYGRSRSRLINQVTQALNNHDVLSASPGYTNRIHEDDCVGFICHLINLLEKRQPLARCYIGTDSCPVAQAEVYQYIADQLLTLSASVNIGPIKIETAVPAASSRRAGSKQCMNTLMKQSGYSLKFETYKEGYLASLRDSI